jgi:hypothetical protein
MNVRRRRRAVEWLTDRSVGVLESRILPAGNVTAVFDGSDLVITGDKAANSVQVLYDGADVLVRGLNGTKINGGVADFVAAGATSTLPGGVDVNLLKGNDLFYMSGGVVVTDFVFVEPGPGNDSTVILDATVTEEIAVGFPFLSPDDAGNDRVALLNSTASNIFVSLGSGHDLVAFENSPVSETIIVQMGTGNDAVVGDLEATENINVAMGAGNDLLFGNLTAGGFAIDMEAGNDALHLFEVDQNDSTRLAQINLGTGHDKATVGFGGTTSFDSQLQVTGSKGNDIFFLVPGATLNAGISIQEVESTAPYVVILDPAIEKQFSGTLKRLGDFGDFLTALPP